LQEIIHDHAALAMEMEKARKSKSWGGLKK
jgi:hypothetical protein